MRLEFLPQSCDSLNYLYLGTRCAQDFKKCYGAERPMGSVLWFSLPYRLGLPPESLIIAHFFLVMVSVILSTLIFVQLYVRCYSLSANKGRLRLFVGGCSLFIHGVVFFPVIFNSLSDAPAALFSLIAIWLLLLNEINHLNSSIILAISGILFGGSAWIRVFYLYPLLATLSIFLICWLKKRKRQYKELFLMFAFIPIALQFFASYQIYGYVSYLNREPTNKWMIRHLENQDMGYDSIMPDHGYYWSSNCVAADGNLRNSICLMVRKFNFYFGSYSPKTYMEIPSQRRWSNVLLLFNVSAMLGTIYIFIKYRNLFSTAGIISIVYSACIVGEGLLIIPEQRFMVFIQIIISVVFLETIVLFFAKYQPNKKQA